jgi:hypothetical protein
VLFTRSRVVQVTQPKTNIGETNQAPYNVVAAYLHVVPLSELMESVERVRRDAQRRYVVLYGRRALPSGPSGLRAHICERLRWS